MAYFERTGPCTFRATQHVGGAWDTGTQHVAPALGLLAHTVEVDRDARRDDGLVLGRLCYDILGTIPIGEVELHVEVLRPGRTIELVRATLVHDQRPAVVLRAWLMQTIGTTAIAGSSFPAVRGPEHVATWDATTVWEGGFVASAQVRREQSEPGRAITWVRTPQPLIEGEEVSRTAAVAGLLDIANGMTVRADPRRVAFPNLDLTAHLFRQPRGEWLGLDTSVSFGPAGVGLTSSVLHDVDGPIGASAQILTVRPGELTGT